MASQRRILFPDNVTCIAGVCVYPAPPNLNSSDVPTIIAVHHKSRLVPNLLIAAAALLFASFLLLLATYVVHRCRRRVRQARSPSDPPPPPGDDDDLFEEGEGDHHVWHIRTVGLDEATIRSIAAFLYKAKDGLLDGSADCAVCLAEFHDGELLRLLPKCGHAFHLPCVDTWLRSHVNCPLCRAPILAPAAAATDHPENSAPSSSPVINVDPVDSVSASSALVENTQIDIRRPEGDQVVPEEEREGGVVEIGIEIDPTAPSSSLPSSSELPSNLGDDGLQPVRRSVSMDSSSLAALLLRAELEEKSGEERKETETGEDRVVKNGGKQSSAGKGASLQKGTQVMRRSLSNRSGRFFLSRYGRAWNSILPL